MEDRSIRESVITQVDFMSKNVPVASQQITEVLNPRKRPQENQEISEQYYQQKRANLHPIITDNSNGDSINKQGNVELATSVERDISDIFKRVPDEHDLLNLLAVIDDKWYEIGLSLKVPRNVLNGLRHNQASNIVKLDEVIHSWITTTESHLVTWETVIDAIEGSIVNNKQVANAICEHLINTELKHQPEIEQTNCKEKIVEVESIAKNQEEEKITLMTSELSERDKEELKQSSKAQESVSSDQALEEILIISSPKPSIPTVSEDIEFKDQLTDVKKTYKDFLEKEDDKTICKGRYFREIAKTSLHDLPNGEKRNTEVLFRSHHITHYPWGKCHDWYNILQPFHPGIFGNFKVPLQRVHITVDKLCHITHELPAREICRPDYFNFKPTHIVGRAGYTYDGSPIGETYVICEPTNQPPTEETEYQHVSSDENIFPGCYSWWSIDHDHYLPPSSNYYFSDLFTKSSRYGNVKFSGYIMQLLQYYQEAYGINPLPRVQFRCGGTLRYKQEICKVVIVCNDAYPLPEDEFPIIWDDILYDKNGRVADIEPFKVVIQNGISGNRPLPALYSWDTYAFGFYFPNKNYRLRCPKSENFERSEVEHYDESCIKTQPDPNNENKLTCPNRFLDDSESDDEEEYISKKQQQ